MKRFIIIIFVILILIFSLSKPSHAENIISDDLEMLDSNIGNEFIDLKKCDLKKYNLPNHYYGNIDYYSFQAYMRHFLIH